MRKMKKGIALLMMLVMVVVMLAGCKSTDKQSSKDNSSKTTTGDSSKTDTKDDTAEQTKADEGISADSPYAGMGLDLSEKVNIVMYVLGDRPVDMDKVLDNFNEKYLTPWLNTTLEMQFLNWSDYQTKYSLVLAGGEDVDLIYTSSWCYYNDESAKGAFVELTEDFLKTYMPISYPQQPQQSWDQIAIDGHIYAVPKANAAFNGYNFVAYREDMLDKYSDGSIDSWDEHKEFFLKVAEQETPNSGIYASGQRGNDELTYLYHQAYDLTTLADGYNWVYYNKGTTDAPDFSDVFFWFGSDAFVDYALQMAELAEAGVWSSNKINDTTEARAQFENGRVSTFTWNETIYQAGEALEKAGLGTYKAFDITPDAMRARGSYAADATAIATNSKNPERAALVLDAIKGFPEVNLAILGGIEGVHYDLNEDGTRNVLDGAANYPWDSYSWGLQRGDSPQKAGMDPRQAEFRDTCEAKEVVFDVAGFTFDKGPVDAEYAVISGILNEYNTSFNLGVYGKDTEAKVQEYKAALEAAGLAKVTEELDRQYEEFKSRKGF